ncbi:MAG: peptidase U35 [Paracoccaceae bacterium]|nr:MAG: HK97 family phage prohead protease [Alphaproteobacteria bacterium]GIX13150.1 MAG: peptidase U35 [Paracoccaceae bacterium]
MSFAQGTGLETKFQEFGTEAGLTGDSEIAGYASLFGIPDQGGDIVAPGAYAAGLRRLAQAGRRVKMLWQHDPAQPIGIWDEVREDSRGLFVRGRILTGVQRGAEALSLMRAGAIDGLSIGYRTIRAERTAEGRRLTEIDLWEVSLVTFPMLPEARAVTASRKDDAELLTALAQAFARARADLA